MGYYQLVIFLFNINMNTILSSISSYDNQDNLVLLAYEAQTEWLGSFLNETEYNILSNAIERGLQQITFPQSERVVIIDLIKHNKNRHQTKETVRRTAAKTVALIRQYKLETITVLDYTNDELIQCYAEGIVLANYQFLKYVSNKEKLQSSLRQINLLEEHISNKNVTLLNCILEGICTARNLVNEPLSYLTAPQLSKEIEALGSAAGFSVKVLDKAAIKELKMGGLLAVNQGSNTPPTFSILEWKPDQINNQKPIVLVGKGVVYDTGGVSLKPTTNSMDFMKCDMAGSAAVIGTIYALAKANCPIHVIGLVPATDNRPGVDAYVPGDVITMHSGSTVEVMNTDAEGRMLLADALHYAKEYNPELVIDVATLTGSAAHAIGNQGAVFMGTAPNTTKNALQLAGLETHERLVEFPLWDEYEDMLKSDVADLKNLGGSSAGAITAGKFLEHFTDYSWIHIDMAGMAFMHHEDAYRVKGGTGYGVQLLFNFLSKYCN